jgi:hypothetical protein
MTKLSWFGKLLGAGPLLTACLIATAGTAFSGGPAQPQKKIQIKIIVDGKEIDLSDFQPGPATGAEKKAVPATPAVPVTKQLTVAVPRPVSKPDPRIDELVKQAEAIKPGSGEAIRRALEGDVKYRTVTSDYYRYLAASPLRVPTTPGKHVIVLSIEDGKVQVLSDLKADLFKLLPKDMRIELDVKKKIDESRAAATSALERLGERLKPAETKPQVQPLQPGTPAPPTSEIEALRRQLERLNADLQDLRKRLDTGKK